MDHHIQPLLSLDAPELAPYRTLRRQAEHREQGFFVAEGEKVVERLLESQLEIGSLVLPPEGLVNLQRALLARTGPLQVYVVEKALLETLTGYKFYQGYMAVARVPSNPDVATLLRTSPAPRLCAALDGVSNAENVGTLVRTVAAFGGTLLVSGERSASPFLRRAVRNSMGAVFRLPIVETSDLVSTLRLMADQGISVVAAHPHAHCRNLTEIDLTRDVCIVLGSEGEGISPAVLATCSESVAIPMGHSVDSLNVSCASAAFLYEAARQRGFRIVP